MVESKAPDAMAQHDFSHYTLKPHQPPAPTVPANTYGAMVGKINGPLGDADDNHVSIPVKVSSGTGAGVWKVAFNVESNAAPKAAQYRVVDEAVGATGFPSEGFFAGAHLSYKTLGLKGADFK